MTALAPLRSAVAVRLCCFRLDRPTADRARLATLLAPDEQARAGRFRFDRDRDRYVVGRGRLRELLGALTGIAPAALQFRYVPAGKPALADATVEFNLSHAGGLALLAVTDGPAVGVDLEPRRAVPDRDLVAGRAFSPPERAALRSLPESARDDAFLRCWTRKEAYLKAVGGGLLLDLQSFAVSLRAGEPARLAWSADPAEAARWSLADVSASCPGFLAAVAVAGRDISVTDLSTMGKEPPP